LSTRFAFYLRQLDCSFQRTGLNQATRRHEHDDVVPALCRPIPVLGVTSCRSCPGSPWPSSALCYRPHRGTCARKSASSILTRVSLTQSSRQKHPESPALIPDHVELGCLLCKTPDVFNNDYVSSSERYRIASSYLITAGRFGLCIRSCRALSTCWKNDPPFYDHVIGGLSFSAPPFALVRQHRGHVTI